MKNIIIVGDSFCSSSKGWPSTLADSLNLRLILNGSAGMHWWATKEFLDKLPQKDKDECEVIIFAHTLYTRIPGSVNFEVLESSEMKQAAKLYNKYISDDNFLRWAETQWYKEISAEWSHIKLINLHSFPFSIPCMEYLDGVNILPNLLAISLNEIAMPIGGMISDIRLNHLNQENNLVLAEQLCDIIDNYQCGIIKLDTSKFVQITDMWSSWGMRP